MLLPDLRDVKLGEGRLAAMGRKEGNIPVSAGPTAWPTADQQTSVELLCLYQALCYRGRRSVHRAHVPLSPREGGVHGGLGEPRQALPSF